MTLRIGSLFSGAGGLDLAVEHVTGGRTVWHCEADPDASKVLAAHWPDVPNLGDITAVDWSQVEPVDVLCGGFPCQDVSAAGRRAGLVDGTRSGLWHEMARAIEALRPARIVIENVEGLLTADGEEWPPEVIAADDERSRWNRICALIDSKIRRAKDRGWWHGQYRTRKKFEAARASRLRKRAVARFKSLHRRLVQRAIAVVVGTLAELGYDTQWGLVSAAEVGAPHRRKRIFITAHATGQSRSLDQRDPRCATADPEGDRWNQGWPESTGLFGRPDAALGGDEADRLELLPTPTASRYGSNQSLSSGAAVRPGLDSIADLLPTPSVADGMGGHLSRSGARSDELLLPGVAKAYAEGALLPTPAASDGARGPDYARVDREASGGDDLITTVFRAMNDSQWGKYGPAIRRWESITREAPAPTELGPKGAPRLAAPFSEWMQGWPLGWVTHVAISRSAMLRIIGNGVVPQQAIAALYWLLSVWELAA